MAATNIHRQGKFKAGNPQAPVENQYKKIQSWLQVSYENETYHKISPKFTLGAYLEAYYSSRNFSNNYTATLMEAGEFAPTAHSKVTYNEAFRANQYTGIGAIPIYQ